MTSMRASLIAYYPMGEASGDILDAHTGGHHLTQTSGTMDSAAGPGSGLSLARDFEAGDTEYATRSHHVDFRINNDPFTAVAWVRAESFGGNRTIFGKNAGTGTNNEWNFGYGVTPNRFRFSVEDAATGTVNTTVLADNLGIPAINTWYLVVVTHQPDVEIGISVNAGQPNTAAFSGGVRSVSRGVFLGAFGDASGYWDGRIAGVGLWRRVLTQGQIVWLYNGGAGRSYAEIIAMWPDMVVVPQAVRRAASF